MKRLMKFTIHAALIFIFFLDSAYSSMDQIEQPKSNFILFTHLALQDSAIGPFLILPKSSNMQSDVSFLKDGLYAFRVDKEFFDQAVGYLDKRKSTGAFCTAFGSDASGFGTFEMRWDLESEGGSLRVGLNDSLAIFEDLDRLPASSGNKSLTEFMGIVTGKLKQAVHK